ncbi:Choline transport protein [Fusarium oxysporum f. sp. albedinis]|nr:Choline transport protein [Fusarium oxysporum f. sp. albedinis]
MGSPPFLSHILVPCNLVIFPLNPMLANEQQLTLTYRPVNGRKVSIGDGEVESELSELSSTVHSASGVDFHELEDEIIVGACTNGARKSCPLRPASDPEDETMADTDDEPVASHYPNRKRTSVFHDLREGKMEPLRSLSGERQPPAVAARAKAPRTSTGRVKSVILGCWRDSPGPTEDLKHAVIGFIDIRKRLRTQIQPTTMAGETISDEYPLPPGPGGSWVTFERIIFLKHLIGLDHLQVKEYVKIRADSMGTEETEAEQVAAKTAAVKEAMRRAKLSLTAENTTSPPQIAYGVELPDHLQQSRDPKRRRRSGGFNPINTVLLKGPVVNTPIKPVPGGPQPVQNVIYPISGTLPTRILLGHWAKSDEPDPKDRHAVYGILGQNGMFRIKLVRETRDGRFVDGNFPTRAGALWIAYEEVAFEPHLRFLARNEVKEYCRVRQWQIDGGETAEEKTANEIKAVYEAQARVAGTNHKAATPLSIAPTLPHQPDNYVEETDQTGRLGFGGHELRQSRRVEAARAEARPARQVLVEVDTPQPPPVPLPATSSTPQSNNTFERTSALAEREITRVELAQERAHLNAANRERAAAAAAIPQITINGRQHLHEREEMQRLDKVWARQESLRMKARAEDAKMYSGVKYERKANGPFTGKLVSQGTIIQPKADFTSVLKFSRIMRVWCRQG